MFLIANSTNEKDKERERAVQPATRKPSRGRRCSSVLRGLVEKSGDFSLEFSQLFGRHICGALALLSLSLSEPASFRENVLPRYGSRDYYANAVC